MADQPTLGAPGRLNPPASTLQQQQQQGQPPQLPPRPRRSRVVAGGEYPSAEPKTPTRRRPSIDFGSRLGDREPAGVSVRRSLTVTSSAADSARRHSVAVGVGVVISESGGCILDAHQQQQSSVETDDEDSSATDALASALARRVVLVDEADRRRGARARSASAVHPEHVAGALRSHTAGGMLGVADTWRPASATGMRPTSSGFGQSELAERGHIGRRHRRNTLADADQELGAAQAGAAARMRRPSGLLELSSSTNCSAHASAPSGSNAFGANLGAAAPATSSVYVTSNNLYCSDSNFDSERNNKAFASHSDKSPDKPTTASTSRQAHVNINLNKQQLDAAASLSPTSGAELVRSSSPGGSILKPSSKGLSKGACLPSPSPASPIQLVQEDELRGEREFNQQVRNKFKFATNPSGTTTTSAASSSATGGSAHLLGIHSSQTSASSLRRFTLCLEPRQLQLQLPASQLGGSSLAPKSPQSGSARRRVSFSTVESELIPASSLIRALDEPPVAVIECEQPSSSSSSQQPQLPPPLPAPKPPARLCSQAKRFSLAEVPKSVVSKFDIVNLSDPASKSYHYRHHKSPLNPILSGVQQPQTQPRSPHKPGDAMGDIERDVESELHVDKCSALGPSQPSDWPVGSKTDDRHQPSSQSSDLVSPKTLSTKLKNRHKEDSRVETIMANAKLRQEEFARLLEEHEQIVNEINRVETEMSSGSHGHGHEQVSQKQDEALVGDKTQ